MYNCFSLFSSQDLNSGPQVNFFLRCGFYVFSNYLLNIIGVKLEKMIHLLIILKLLGTFKYENRLQSNVSQRKDYPFQRSLTRTVGIWISTIWIPNFLKFQFQMVGLRSMSYLLDQPFEYWTITKETWWRPFVYQTNSVFKSPLYS